MRLRPDSSRTVQMIRNILDQIFAEDVDLVLGPELVEEYTVAAKKVITTLIVATTFIYVLFIFFDRLPWSIVVCGLLAQLCHLLIMHSFPFVMFTSIPFIGSCIMLVINHWLAYSYFFNNWYQFSEVLGYFTLCLWTVPFALFVSLSANDNVLPTINERSPLLNDNDIVTNYFSNKGKKGLLSLFTYAKESILPQRNKNI
ncbi:Protein TEX261, partial [Pseudolycoriella hygida]